MERFCVRTAPAMLFVAAAGAASLCGQTYTVLANFNGANGANPYYAPLAQGTNGDFYGTTGIGGAYNTCPQPGVAVGCGTVFKITPGGTLTTLHSFGGPDGAWPYAGLVLATDGNFYGTTDQGGANQCVNIGCGTVFKMTPSGTLTTLHSFSGPDGIAPYAGLIQLSSGAFYGTTNAGGTLGGWGTLFQITPSGTLTTLASFNQTDGANPYGGMVQASNGAFYGTTYAGPGTQAYGEVFKFSAGVLSTLYAFYTAASGSGPTATLIQATDGNLYGTTEYGGAHKGGTLFRITEGGTPTILYSFCAQSSCADGANPTGGVIQANDGNFYGTTNAGGQNDCGTVFEYTAAGKLTTVYSFNCTGGQGGYGGLMQGTDGILYGASTYGGPNYNCLTSQGFSLGCGSVYRLNLGLAPFIKTVPTSGKAGTAVRILGGNLTNATSVTFNGKTAVFKVVAASEITTTVPVGATTGPVQVNIPTGILTSNVPFVVH